MKSSGIFALAVFQLLIFARAIKKDLQLVTEERRSVVMMKQTAAFIKANYPSTSKLAVYDAGYIPFATRMRCLDVQGLMDSDITMFEYNQPQDNFVQVRPTWHKVERFFQFNPDVFVLASVDTVIMPWFLNRTLLTDARFANRYEFVTRFGYHFEYPDPTNRGNFMDYYEYVLQKTRENKSGFH